MHKRILCVLIPLLATLLSSAQAETGSRPPELDLPVKCTLGKDCFIQHFIDTDPSENAADYTCGSLTYNNHRGTDIRLPTLADMTRGVPVIAAASGRVANLRDGMKDQYYSDYSAQKKKEIFKKGLGNAVILSHGGGWETYYAHLKKGSLTVSKGQEIRKGDILGYVGMSGLTDFPHLHFELRHKNKRIDPFSGKTAGQGCENPDINYWSALTRKALSYQQTGFMATGMSETRPQGRKDLESGSKAQDLLDRSAPTLFFWSYYIGSREGDRVSITLKDPDGKVLATSMLDPMPRNQISRTVFVGKRKPAQGWKHGVYHGEITINRNGTILKDSAVITVQ